MSGPRRALQAVILGLAVGVMSGAAVVQPPVRMFWVTEDGDPADFPSGTSVVPGIRGEQVCMEIWLQGLGGDFLSIGAECTIDDRAAFSGGGTLVADCTTPGIDTSHVNDAGWGLNIVQFQDCGPNGAMDRVRFIRAGKQFPTAKTIPTSGAYFA